MASENVLTLRDADFQTVISGSAGPVLVDFWAEWCSPCKMIAPLIEEVAEEFKGKIRIGKLNVDENRATPASLNVQSIPTLIIFVNGREVERYVGFKTKAELSRIINRHIAGN